MPSVFVFNMFFCDLMGVYEDQQHATLKNTEVHWTNLLLAIFWWNCVHSGPPKFSKGTCRQQETRLAESISVLTSL